MSSSLCYHCVSESIQCCLSLAAPLMQLCQRSICVSCAFALTLTFQSLHVANALLTQARNYIIASARLGSPGYTEANEAAWTEIKSHCVLTRETWFAKAFTTRQFTTRTTQDKIINTNASKAPRKSKSKCECSPLTQCKHNTIHKRSPSFTHKYKSTELMVSCIHHEANTAIIKQSIKVCMHYPRPAVFFVHYKAKGILSYAVL